MSIESVMPFNHLILCCPLLLLPSIFSSIRVFSTELAFHIRWPRYWSLSFRISPSNEYSGLISFRMDWFDSKGLSRIFSNTTVQKQQFFGCLMGRTDSLEKTLMLGKIEGRRRRGWQRMAGWHHWLDGHEFEWTLGFGVGQEGLACCNSWGRRVGHDWATELTELNWSYSYSFSPSWLYKSGYSIGNNSNY